MSEIIKLKNKGVTKAQVLDQLDRQKSISRTYRLKYLKSFTGLIYGEVRTRRQLVDDFSGYCRSAHARVLGDGSLASLDHARVDFCIRMMRTLDLLFAMREGGVPRDKIEDSVKAALKRQLPGKKELLEPLLLELFAIAYDDRSSLQGAIEDMPGLCLKLFERHSD